MPTIGTLILGKYVDELAHLKTLRFNNEEFPLWVDKVKDTLRLRYGQDSEAYARFEGSGSPRLVPDFGGGRQLQQIYLESLQDYERGLRSVIQMLELQGTLGPGKAAPRSTVAIRPKIFIAHGGHTHNRDQLELFLWRKGYRPIIVEEMPDIGKNPDQKVDFYLGQCVFGVAIAEKETASSQEGKPYPRLNVVDEIVRIRKTLGPKYKVLLEAGVSLPSDESVAITWQSFSQDSLYRAFAALESEIEAQGIVGVSE